VALRVLAITGCAVLACGDSVSNNHPPADPKPHDQVWSKGCGCYRDASKMKWSWDEYAYVYYSTATPAPTPTPSTPYKVEYTCSGVKQMCGFREAAQNSIQCYQDECCMMNFTQGNTRFGLCMKSGFTAIGCSSEHSYNKNKGCPNNAIRQLARGERLESNMRLWSLQGHVSLVMSKEGNLIMYERDQTGKFKPIWSSKTGGNPGASLRFQTDGKVRLQTSLDKNPQGGSNRWKGTAKYARAAALVMQDDCDLVLVDSEHIESAKVVWSLGTSCQYNAQGEIVV